MEQLVKEKLDRALDMFDGSFVHISDELILSKKWNIYFRLPDIKTASEFDYKILSYLSFYTASHHFKPSSAQSKWALNKINRWFKKEFTIDEMQKIYAKLGNGANRELGVRFIESGFEMELLTINAE